MNRSEGESAGVDWTRVREDYEAGAGTLAAIAARHGISPQTLSRRRRDEGWTARRVRKTPRVHLIARLLAVLDNQTKLMEMKMGRTDNFDAAEMRLLDTMTKTLDRLIALENAEAMKQEPRRSDPEVAALRRKLADRIASLEKK